MEGINRFRVNNIPGGCVKRRLKFSNVSESSGFPKEIRKKRKPGLLPILSFLGAALVSPSLHSTSFPQNTQSNKISLKYIKRKKTITPFFAPAEWEIYQNYFLVMRAFHLSNGKVTIVALMESTPEQKKPNKRVKTFSIFRFEKKGDKWKISNSFSYKLDGLERQYLTKGQLKGGKIVIDYNSYPRVFLFYVVPDNGIATGLQNEQPLTPGLPVAVFKYDENRRDVKELGIKSTSSP